MALAMPHTCFIITIHFYDSFPPYSEIECTRHLLKPGVNHFLSALLHPNLYTNQHWRLDICFHTFVSADIAGVIQQTDLQISPRASVKKTSPLSINSFKMVIIPHLIFENIH